jgi:hypothetical protein
MVKVVKFILFLLLLLLVLGIIIFKQSELNKFSENWVSRQHLVSKESVFELKKGDILVRPNMDWLPGSMPIPGGRKYGHVAIVVEGAVGQTAEEALKNSRVVEALFFDQKTKKFLFNRKYQIREEYAWVSFGKKFGGIRYRLRVPLTKEQSDSICSFVCSQLGTRYNILSLKQPLTINDGFEFTSTNRKSWQCATLTWNSYYKATGFDIDGNGGLLIFPSDIIGSEVFDRDSSRICF